MRLKYAILTGFLLLGLCFPARAQYVLTGSAPAGTRWSQIKGEHFDVIFPSEIDSLARAYLFYFEKTRSADLAGLHIETPHMPIVLQPYDMNSNGMVAWAPRRVELYTTPPGDALYALNWEMQLATHEGRHIGQMAHYTKGIYRVLNLIAGEQGSAVGVGLYPTRVLLEGDAVQNETDLSASGRGRDPEFLKFFRASFVDGDFRSWADWRYGSYRHYTPGKYQLGYLMVSTMRDVSKNYWAVGDIMATQVHDWWHFFSVAHTSYIRATGRTGRKNWRAAIAGNTRTWVWEYSLRAPYTETTPLLARRDSVYTEIANPVPLEGQTLATMWGMQFERRLIGIDSLGNRHYRHPLSATTSTLVADSDHSLIFSEIVPDPRWEHRSWSVIRRYDAKKNRFETLTRRTRYLNPTPSAGRDSILAAEYRVGGGSDVVVLDRDGKLLDRISGPDQGQVTGVADLRGNLYASAITPEGMGLFRYADGAWSPVVDPQSRMIRDLRTAGDSLLCFVSDLDGLSNIYTFDPDENRLYRINSTRFSSANPALAPDGTLYYADYDRFGYQPVAVPFDGLPRKKASFSHPYHNALADRNSQQAAEHAGTFTAEADSLLRSRIDSLESRHYSKPLHGIHIHSWAPFYANIGRLMNDLGGFDLAHFSNWYQYVAPGATLISQNNLGTLVTVLGYSYHDRHHGGHAYVSYSGLYPKFELAVDYNERSSTRVEYGYDPDEGPTVHADTLTRPGLNINAAVSLPLNFSRGGWTTRVTPQINYVVNNDTFHYPEKDDDPGLSGNLTQLLVGTIRFDTRLARPTARLTPRLGFGAQLSGQTRLGPEIHRNHLYAFNAWTYLPGFGREDGFKLSYARQFQPSGAWRYTADYNLVRMPFGFSREILMDYHRMTAEYALPIYAGDLDGGFFFYLKRFMLIPFADFAIDRDRTFFSYGSALLVNTRLFRIGTDFQLGVRYARRNLPGDRGRVQFIMSTGL